MGQPALSHQHVDVTTHVQSGVLASQHMEMDSPEVEELLRQRGP